MTAHVTVDAPLLRSDEPGVAVLTLNRPAARNSLSEAMMAALHQVLDAITGDATIRAVVLAANGPVFCAGHDLKEMTAHRADADGGRAYYEEMFARCSALMRAIIGLPQPVIALVEGVATAAGCQLVATCDLAVASRDARFATPGVDIGLFCSTPMVALSRNVSRKHALAMLLTGDPVSADEALRIGLVNEVTDDGKAREAALRLARIIASKSPLAMRTGKRAFHRQIEMPLAEAYEEASRVMVENMLGNDAGEGIRAFIEKREPRWSGT